jgi:hypothetical protein
MTPEVERAFESISALAYALDETGEKGLAKTLRKDDSTIYRAFFAAERELAILTEQRDNHLNRLLKERAEHEREIERLTAACEGCTQPGLKPTQGER